jgi:hypothetical protein
MCEMIVGQIENVQRKCGNGIMLTQATARTNSVTVLGVKSTNWLEVPSS